MPLFVDASLSALANFQASSHQNSKHRTVSRSQIHVCRYPFMAGSRHKHFLQIFIHTTLPEMMAGTFFTVPQCLSSSRQQQQQKQPPPECLFSNPSRLNSSATAWTQLSDAFILFCGSAATTVGWLICRETLLPARRSQSKAGRNDGGLSERRICRRINLSLLLTVTASPPDLSCLPGSLGAAESMKICCRNVRLKGFRSRAESFPFGKGQRQNLPWIWNKKDPK